MPRDGTEHRLPADTLLLHQGVIPNLNLANATGCAQRWDERQRCWRPTTDDWGATSVEGVSLAGDGAGIGGGLFGRAVRDENRTELDFSQVSVNARTVWDLFPCMRGATIVRSWAGIEARMPDQIPVIGPSGTEPDLYHSFGFPAHGFQLGPIVGRITADLIAGGSTDLPIAPFSIGRFAA